MLKHLYQLTGYDPNWHDVGSLLKELNRKFGECVLRINGELCFVQEFFLNDLNTDKKTIAYNKITTIEPFKPRSQIYISSPHAFFIRKIPTKTWKKSFNQTDYIIQSLTSSPSSTIELANAIEMQAATSSMKSITKHWAMINNQLYYKYKHIATLEPKHINLKYAIFKAEVQKLFPQKVIKCQL